MPITSATYSTMKRTLRAILSGNRYDPAPSVQEPQLLSFMNQLTAESSAAATLPTGEITALTNVLRVLLTDSDLGARSAPSSDDVDTLLSQLRVDMVGSTAIPDRQYRAMREFLRSAMSDINYPADPFISDQEFLGYFSPVAVPVIALVLPIDTASALFDYRPLFYLGPSTVTEFVSGYLLPDLNTAQGASGTILQRSTSTAGRMIYLVLNTSPLVLSAPADVQALLPGLAVASPESYIVRSTFKGDIWLIGRRAEGLRHAGYDYIQSLGARYFGPHIMWQEIPEVGAPSLNVAKLVTPSWSNYIFAGNGGQPNNHGPSVAGPFQTELHDSAAYWNRWDDQEYRPRESIAFQGGDGGCSDPYFKQTEYNVNRRQLAWVPSAGVRGANDVGGPVVAFPINCFAGQDSVNAKACYTHHGTSGATFASVLGSPPAGPDPWSAFAVSGPSCVVPNPMPGHDVRADSGTPDATDYQSFGGGNLIRCLHARDTASTNIKAQIAAGSDALSPFNYYVSTSPADGPYECLCQACLDLLRNGPYGAYLTTAQKTQDSTISDRIAHESNEIARFFTWCWQNSATVKPGVAYLPYQDHSDVPSIPLYPNVSVCVVSGSISNTKYTRGEIIDQWSVKLATNPLGAFKLGWQPTWEIASALFDVPRLSAYEAISEFRYFTAKGYTTGFLSQTSYSQFSMGFTYWAIGKLIYSPSRTTESLAAEWFGSFGAASAQMRATHERWWDWYELTSHEIGQSCLDMQAAQATLSADATHTSKQQQRLDLIRGCVHWLKLFKDYVDAKAAYAAAVNPTTLANYLAAIDAAINWAWDIAPWNAIEADLYAGENLYTAIPATGTGTDALRAKWDKTNASSAVYDGTVVKPTTASLTSLMASDLAACPVVAGVSRIKFSCTVPNPTQILRTPSFTGTLAQLTTTADTTLVATVRLCRLYQCYVFKKQNSTDLNFDLQQAQLNAGAATLPTRIRVLDVNGNQLHAWEFTASNPAGFDQRNMTITGLAAGTYLLELNDCQEANGNQYLEWPKHTPLAWLNPQCTREFQQAVKVYFYTPLTRAALSMGYISTDPIQFYKPNGSGGFATQTTTHVGIAQHSCVVPGGLDGQVWAFDHIQTGDLNSTPHLENAPNLFSFCPEHVMVPSGLDGHT